ncbi:MAG: HAMP domain-containing protein [Pyrinomonadaceae bacterium]|nr:HAMP domain-containing protein [Pyrinomonadaceae bacterium]
MSLFLKIFLWFWLAIGLIAGAIMVVNWSTSSESLARQRRAFVGEATANTAETAIQIYNGEGVAGLQKFLQRQVERRRRFNAIGFYDEDRELIAGSEIKDIDDLVERAFASGNPEFKRLEMSVLVAKTATAADGKKYLYVVERRRFQGPPFFTTRLLLQILSVMLIGGLVCYALARYLTSPIEKLRSATKALSVGNFESRVGTQIGGRKDELASLAKDFDDMADQIESLIDSEKRLTQDISHELRSPLARMNVALELARSKSNEQTVPLLDRLEKESERLNDLISQLLTLSKLETGAATFEKSEVDLTKLVAEIVADADFEAKSMDRGVEMASPDMAIVYGNENLIRSAVENVLRNASRYTAKGTKVEVKLTSDLHTAKLEIRDFGAGVPDEELEKLFKPFYRISQARDRKSGGVGLGLAIAEQAIRNHDGEIVAKNTDEGLLVTIKMPVAA